MTVQKWLSLSTSSVHFAKNDCSREFQIYEILRAFANSRNNTLTEFLELSDSKLRIRAKERENVDGCVSPLFTYIILEIINKILPRIKRNKNLLLKKTFQFQCYQSLSSLIEKRIFSSVFLLKFQVSQCQKSSKSILSHSPPRPIRFLHSNVPIATDYNFSSSNCSNSVELTQFHERFDKFLLGA